MSRIVDDYRAALGSGKLLIQKCSECATMMMYPRYRCIACGSDDLGWQAASGDATLKSYTVVRAVPPTGFEDALPYALGVVRLDEGVQILARLHPQPNGDWVDYRCEARVEFMPASADEVHRRPVAWFGLARP